MAMATNPSLSLARAGGGARACGGSRLLLVDRFAYSDKKLGIDPSSKMFHCYRSRINEIYSFIIWCEARGLGKKNASLKALVAEVNQWASCFLLRGAKYPLVHERDADVFSRSYLDYFCSGNTTYFRSTGSGVLKLLQNLMESKYDYLKDGRLSYYPVDSSDFVQVLEGCSDFGIKIHSLDEINDSLVRKYHQLVGDAHSGTRCFIDLTPLFKRARSPLEQNRLLAEINDRIEALNIGNGLEPQLIIGGVIDVSINGHSNPSSADTIPTFICVEDSQKCVQSLVQTSGYGLCLAKVPRLLGALGLGAPQIRDLVGAGAGVAGRVADSQKNPPSLILRETLEKLKAQISALGEQKEALQGQDYLINEYYFRATECSLSLLEGMRKLECPVEGIPTEELAYNQRMNALIASSLMTISENVVDKMGPANMDLIFEEIVFLLSICDPIGTIPEFPEVVAKYCGNCGDIEPAVTVQSSGMAGFTNIIMSLFSTKPRAEGQELKVLCSKASYFELAQLLRLHRGSVDQQIRTFSPQEIRAMEVTDSDVIFLDLHANNFALTNESDMALHDFRALQGCLERNLEHRSTPLTLVIDVSTTVFYSKEVKDLVAGYADLVSSGKLNLVLISSLEKYCMGGFDKFSGGVTISYSNTEGSPENAMFNQLMTEYAHRLNMPKIVGEFAKLLMIATVPLKYKNLCHVNNTELTRRLSLLQAGTGSEFAKCFTLIDPRDPSIPLTGLRLVRKGGGFNKQFYEAFATLVKDWFVVQAAQAGLKSISKRMSFAFMHPNVSACLDVLRIEPGIIRCEEMRIMVAQLQQLALNINEMWSDKSVISGIEQLALSKNFKEESERHLRKYDVQGPDSPTRLIQVVSGLLDGFYNETFEQATRANTAIFVRHRAAEGVLDIGFKQMVANKVEEFGLKSKDRPIVYRALKKVIREYLQWKLSITPGDLVQEGISEKDPSILKVRCNGPLVSRNTMAIIQGLEDVASCLTNPEEFAFALENILFSECAELDDQVPRLGVGADEKNPSWLRFSSDFLQWLLSRHKSKSPRKKVTKMQEATGRESPWPSFGRGSPSPRASFGRGSPSPKSSAGRDSPRQDLVRGSPSPGLPFGRGSPSPKSSAGRDSPRQDLVRGSPRQDIVGGGPSPWSSVDKDSPRQDMIRGSPSPGLPFGKGSPPPKSSAGRDSPRQDLASGNPRQEEAARVTSPSFARPPTGKDNPWQRVGAARKLSPGDDGEELVTSLRAPR